MVDLKQVPQMGALMSEYRRLASALTNLEQGGKIVNMTVAMGERPAHIPPNAPMPGVMISTVDWDMPVDLVKDKIKEQRDKIAKQLVEMGVTGLG